MYFITTWPLFDPFFALWWFGVIIPKSRNVDSYLQDRGTHSEKIKVNYFFMATALRALEAAAWDFCLFSEFICIRGEISPSSFIPS